MTKFGISKGQKRQSLGISKDVRTNVGNLIKEGISDKV